MSADRMWDDEAREQVIALWREGMLSANEIGKQFGVSRSAIIGLTFRAGLRGLRRGRRPEFYQRKPKLQAAPPAPKPRVDKRAPTRFVDRPASAAEKAASRAAFAALMQEAASRQEVARVASLLELEPHHCRWPIGERPSIAFCGERRVDGSSYCAIHAARSIGMLNDRTLDRLTRVGVPDEQLEEYAAV